MNPELAGPLVEYFTERERQRAEGVARVLAALTDRERRLVREAAVMGYVTGVRCGPYRPAIPTDSAIVAEVVGRCQAMPDLYPTISEVDDAAS